MLTSGPFSPILHPIQTFKAHADAYYANYWTQHKKWYTKTKARNHHSSSTQSRSNSRIRTWWGEWWWKRNQKVKLLGYSHSCVGALQVCWYGNTTYGNTMYYTDLTFVGTHWKPSKNKSISFAFVIELHPWSDSQMSIYREMSGAAISTGIH